MALTQDAKIIRYGTPGNSTQPATVPTTASAQFYRGSVATSRAGFLVEATAPQSTDIVWGVIEGVDPANPGGQIDGQPGFVGGSTNGAVSALIATGSFWLSSGTGADSLAQANAGQTVYLINETTVGATSGGGTRPVAGVLIKASDALNVLNGMVAVHVGNVGNAAGQGGSPS